MITAEKVGPIAFIIVLKERNFYPANDIPSGSAKAVRTTTRLELRCGLSAVADSLLLSACWWPRHLCARRLNSGGNIILIIRITCQCRRQGVAIEGNHLTQLAVLAAAGIVTLDEEGVGEYELFFEGRIFDFNKEVDLIRGDVLVFSDNVDCGPSPEWSRRAVCVKTLEPAVVVDDVALFFVHQSVPKHERFVRLDIALG